MKRLVFFTLVFASLLPLSGCGGAAKGLSVKGRIVENGSPLQASTDGLPPGTRPIQIIFHQIPAGGQVAGESYFCEVNTETGEFTVKDPSNKGIPAGKYRISVTVASPGKAAGPPGINGPNPAGVMGFSDRFRGAYDPQNTKLEVELTSSAQVLVDVGKGTATVENASTK